MYEDEMFLLSLIGIDFFLGGVAGNGEEERKRHALALGKLQRIRDKLNKRKPQKAKIKEELLPIAWHPSRCWDWCIPKDKKKETEKLWK